MSYSTNQQRGHDAYSGRPPNPAGTPDMRNGSGGRNTGRPGDEALSNQDRAARFEDEKKRIIESCFSKRDPDGTQLESYITHVRVTEDAMHPSSPPPPNAPAANKKNRTIIVAVRRSGKVRVHKARENPNGSFSIGKTWNLDEMTSIQSYTAFVPMSNQDSLDKQWAGNIGFIVGLGKPYYWQASTPKEKDFFIASLTKIFRKYTGGRAPVLTGFGPQEMEMLTGGTPGSTPLLNSQSPNPAASPGQPTLAPAPPSMPAAASPRPQSPLTPRPLNRVNNQSDNARDPGYNRPDNRTPGRETQRVTSEEPVRSPARYLLQPASNEDVRKRSQGDRPLYQDNFSKSSSLAADVPQPLRPSASPKTSISNLSGARKPSDDSVNRTNSPSQPVPPFAPSKRTYGSSKSQDSIAAGSDYSMPSRPGTAPDSRSSETIPPLPNTHGEPLLERPRAQIGQNKDASRSQKSLENTSASQFSTPIGTPGAVRADEPPPLNLNKANNSQQDVSQSQTDYLGSKPRPLKPSSQDTSRVSTPATQPAIVSEVSVQPETTRVASPENMASPSEGDLSPKKEEEYRPGLGPMIKKKSGKDIANQFRKAALAASAFQPRQGGAGARLKAMQDKNTNEPDGITGVVPAPLLRGMSNDSTTSSTQGVTSPPLEKDKERPRTPLANAFLPKVQLQRTATDESVKPAKSGPKPVDEPKVEFAPEITDPQPRPGSPQRRKRQKLEAEIEKYCSVLNIDPRVMDGRGADFNEILSEFGWEGRLGDKQKVEDFESAIRRENGRAQASGWLGHVEQQEVRVQDLAKAFDKAIAECEEMDGLLTLYSHELDTLAEDIEYIEAQSQGLQVQTANQKLLQAELQSLLKTLTISSSDLRSLHTGSLDSNEGVQSVERALSTLYRALLTIDPEIRQNKTRKAAAASNDRTGVGVYADQEIGQMRAVRQKKEEYREETLSFLRRFNQHMTIMFKAAEQRTSEENSRSVASASTTSLMLPSLQHSRQELWLYNPMMLFVREVNNYEWSTLISSYEINIKPAYTENFRDFASAHRKNARKPAGEEVEVLFTHQEKEKGGDSLATTATRKLTVKRGKAVKAGGARQTFDRRDDKADAWEVFDTVLQEQSKVIAEEQNFIVHFFHLTSQSNVDFLDNVSSRSPNQRTLPSLSTQLPYDPDRDLAKQVQSTIEGIYSFWPTELQALMEWVIRSDQLQGVGVLCALERSLSVYEETNQEYLTRTIRTLHDRLVGLFHKFVDEQVKAVEETKVKVSKRKGVISFMRTFPVFSAAVEQMIPQDAAPNDQLEVRFVLNDAYAKLLKAMWESLNFIAKDNPASGSGAGQTGAPAGGDPEDKEALNYHILLIENMHHYMEEVEVQQNVVLEEWRERAEHDMYKHLTAYTDAVIRRPLGKWLDFVESTEALMKTTDSYGGIANKPSHSRSSAKKMLGSYDAKEVRKGVETLKKRIEKHFGDVDDPANTSKGLIARVLEECSTRYAHAYDRMKTIVDQVYDGSLEMEWRKEEVAALFKR
jgi:exocyst complex component 1